MSTTIAKAEIFGSDVEAGAQTPAQLAKIAREHLARHHAVFIRGFPIDMDALTEFLGQLGSVLPNYESKSNGGGEAGSINRVKYNKPKDRNTYVHEKSGPLKLHTARSWRTPRPRFMSMLMVDPGWRGYQYGMNGESAVVWWKHAFIRCADLDNSFLSRKLPLLRNTPIRFTATRVIEDFSTQPLVYDVNAPTHDLDYGVRFKQDMVEVLETLADKPPRFSDYLEAVKLLAEVANTPGVAVAYPMDRGDLVVLDNNRFGHGRLNFIPERENSGRIETNPREIWSATIQ